MGGLFAKFSKEMPKNSANGAQPRVRELRRCPKFGKRGSRVAAEPSNEEELNAAETPQHAESSRAGTGDNLAEHNDKLEWNVCADDLAVALPIINLKKFVDCDGLELLADKRRLTLIINRISTSESSLNMSQEDYGINKSIGDIPDRDSFWISIQKALQDKTVNVLGVYALGSSIVGIVKEGWPQGAKDGFGIAASIMFVVLVTAARQSLKSKDLDKEKKTTSVQVTRAGCNQMTSVSDLLPGDILHLSMRDHLVNELIADLKSRSIEEKKQAAMMIRLLAKDNAANRVKIGRAGAIEPLIELLSSTEPQLQEISVTAILNLSICEENRELMASSGAIILLAHALKVGTPAAKGNAAVALLNLSKNERNKISIGRSGAIELLVNLLENGNLHEKKDACIALYSLCSVKENKMKAVKAGIVKTLVKLMADFGSNMVDKSASMLSLLLSGSNARAALVKEDGIKVLLDIVEFGTQGQKEIAVMILLQLCGCPNGSDYRAMLVRVGALQLLVALTQSATSDAKQKAEMLIGLLQQPPGNAAAEISHI